METTGESVNLGNPENALHDEIEENSPKVTMADHPRIPGSGADDLFDDSVPDDLPAPAAVATQVVTPPTPAAVAPSLLARAAVAPSTRTAVASNIDMHAPTVTDPELEMVGDTTSHHDPFSGESGTHPVGVGVEATAGSVAVGAATGFVAGAFAGPLGAAVGTAAGALIGGIAGGYVGKGVAESLAPTTEDHFWRSRFHSRPYVAKNARYQDYEPAYAYGIQMRERLLDQSWEEAEVVVRTGWEQSDHAVKLPWARASPAILDAWDHLTPEPDDPDGTDEEKIADE